MPSRNDLRADRSSATGQSMRCQPCSLFSLVRDELRAAEVLKRVRQNQTPSYSPADRDWNGCSQSSVGQSSVVPSPPALVASAVPMRGPRGRSADWLLLVDLAGLLFALATLGMAWWLTGGAISMPRWAE